MFLSPWGLLALFAVPAIVALHLYRRRFRPQPVSALFLWDHATPSPLTGRTRTPLLRSASFWCELLAALFFALLLAGPKGCGQSRHRVVVLDGSASMAATGVSEKAIRTADAYLGELWRWEKVTVVVSGRSPRVLAGPGVAPSAARLALAGYQPAEPGHSLEPALELALTSADGGGILLLTDAEPGKIPAGAGVEAFGTPQANAAIVQASRSPSEKPGFDHVLLVLTGSGQISPATLTLSGDKTDTQSFDFTTDAKKLVELQISSDTSLTATLRAEADALALDNEVTLPPIVKRQLRIAGSFKAPLEANLLGLGTTPTALDRLTHLVPEVESNIPPDLHISSADQSTSAASNLIFYTGTGESRPPGPLLLEDSPVTAGMTLEGAIWSAWSDVTLPGSPIIRAGGTTVMTQVETHAQLSWHLNLDPSRSNLTRLTDWPVLLANILTLARTRLPGPDHRLLRPGEPLLWRQAAPGSWQWTVTLDHLGGDLVLPALPSPQKREIVAPDGTRSLIAAALLDASESNLSSRGSFSKAPPPDTSNLPGELPALTLSILIVLLLTLDLAVLGKQATS